METRRWPRGGEGDGAPASVVGETVEAVVGLVAAWREEGLGSMVEVMAMGGMWAEIDGPLLVGRSRGEEDEAAVRAGVRLRGEEDEAAVRAGVRLFIPMNRGHLREARASIKWRRSPGPRYR